MSAIATHARAAATMLRLLAESRRACMVEPGHTERAAATHARDGAVNALSALHAELTVEEQPLWRGVVAKAIKAISSAVEDRADDLALAGRLLTFAADVEHRERIDQRPTDPDLVPMAEEGADGPLSSGRRVMLPPPLLQEPSFPFPASSHR